MTDLPADGPWNAAPPAVGELDAALASPDPTPRAAYGGSVRLLEHLFAAAVRTDPRTGRLLPQSLHQTMLDLAELLGDGVRPVPEDALARAAALCHAPLQSLLARPRQKLRRVHVLQPVHKVREMDTRSMAWLARQMGRTAREKLAAGRRVQSVRRSLTPDTVENRVARRLMEELHAHIGRRLAAAGSFDAGPADLRRLHLLRQVQWVCAEGLADSPLSDVPPSAGAVRPNYALLSDPVYSRVWRAWGWLRAWEGDVARQWRDGPRRLATAVFWVLVAGLFGRADVLLADAFCQVRDGRGNAGFGVRQLGPGGDWEPPGAPPRLRLLLDPGETATLLDFRLEGNRVRVGLAPLAGVGVVPPGRAEEWEVEAAFAPGRPCPAGRYFPLTARLRREGRTDVFDDMADLHGFRALSDFFCDALARPRAAASPAAPAEAEPPSPGLVGVDPAGARPRVVTDRGPGLTPLDVRLHATHFTFADGTADWLDGRALRSASPWAARSTTLPFSAALEAGGSARRAAAAAAAQRITAALVAVLRPAPRAPLALAVPDALDELAQRALRQAVAAFGKVWLIYRSVAGALGWQTLPSFQAANLREGDSLVVLDAEAPALTATWLVARADARLDGGPARGIYWERKPLAFTDPRAAQAAYRDFQARCCRAAVEDLLRRSAALSPDQEQRLVEHLLDAGGAERLVEQRGSVWAPMPPDSAAADAWIRLAWRRPCDRAASAWLDGLAELLRDWVVKGPFQRVRSFLRESSAPEAAQRSVHVLLLGRPFHDPWVRGQVRDCLRGADGRARDRLGGLSFVEAEPEHELVALGARAFLERHGAGLPTWEDCLPDLYLEMVTGRGVPRFVPLVKDRRAKPGESIAYEVSQDDPDDPQGKEGMRLPAGAECYLFSLLRDPNGSFEAFYDARLESSAFPLSRDAPIRLRVDYRYGEDSFRLVVLPKDEVAAPFPPIVVQWVPGDDEPVQLTASRWNAVPPFPEPTSAGWDPHLTTALRRAAERLEAQAQRVFDADGADARAFARELEELGRTLRLDLLPTCSRLWAPGRGAAPAEILDLLEANVFVPLQPLLRPEEHPSSPPWAVRPPAAVRDALQYAQDAALAVLSCLRSDAPQYAVEALLADLQSASSHHNLGPSYRMLGRILGAGEGERGEAVHWLMRRVRDGKAGLEDLRDGAINLPLLAISAALWGHPRFALTLDRFGYAAALLGVVEMAYKELCERLPHAGKLSDRAQAWKRLLYQNVSEALLALLRLRDQERGRVFTAGSRRMARLARQVRRIDSLFLQAGIRCRSCVHFQESDLEGRTSLSPLAYVLTSYLLGESVPPAIVIDSDADASDESDS